MKNPQNNIHTDKLNSKTKLNLEQNLKKAVEEKDADKIELITKIQSEIEKYLLLKAVREDEELSSFFEKDIIKVAQDGSFNIIEMILVKEIELLEQGDFEAIEMLNKIKKKAEKKLQELNQIALDFKEQQKTEQNSRFIDKEKSGLSGKIEVQSEYKPFIKIEGFHLEKTLGGNYIQTLDADIKNLVGSDIINSKPEDLTKNILDQIKDLRHDLNNTNGNDKANYGEWTKLVNNKDIDNDKGR